MQQRKVNDSPACFVSGSHGLYLEKLCTIGLFRPEVTDMPPLDPATGGDNQAAAARSVRLPAHATILTCIALLCVLIVGLDAWRTWTARGTAVAAAQVETANLARSLAQHAHDTLGAVDTLLVTLRQSVEADGAAAPQRPHLRQLIATQIATVPMLRDLMVFDANGDRIVNSGRPAPEVENIADREYYQYHAANRDRGAHFGKPVRGKLDGTWIVTLSRRIDSPNGDFAGMVEATFAVAALRQFYETFDVGQQGFIGLNTVDGTIITRYPAEDGQIGRNIASKIVYTDRLPTVPMGDWQSVSPVDGIEHLGSYRTVESYPIVLVVGRGVHELLTPWRQDALFHAGVSLCTTTAIILLAARFTRQLRWQQRAEDELKNRERQYRLLAEHSTDVIIQLGPDCRRRYVSPACSALLGYAPDELIGQDPQDAAHPEDRSAAAASLAAIAADGHAPPFAFRFRRRCGQYLWVEGTGRRLPNGEGIAIALRDISARKEAEARLHQANNELQRMAMMDGLTGIANRRCFDLALEKEFRRAARTRQPLSLLLLDVDHFKAFNDNYGHPAGDACLRVIATALAGHVHRPADIVARYGGEEFAILLPETNVAGAADLAERVRRAVALLNIPHRTSQGRVTLSVGVAVIWPWNVSATAADLVLQADAALYQAKTTGRDCTSVSAAPLDAEAAGVA